MGTACDSGGEPSYADADSPVQVRDAGAETDASDDRAEDASAADAAGTADAGLSILDASRADAAEAGAPSADSGSASDASAVMDAVAVEAGSGADASSADAMADDSAASTQDSGSANADAGPSAAPSPKQLVAGRAHACSLDPAIDGLLCWGDNTRGQAKVPTLNAPSSVAAGGDVTCAIEKDGDVVCWGDSSQGQLRVPAQLGRATQVTVGDAHVCALTAAGRVKCWGDNESGQLDAPELTGVRSIGAGARHACALAADGVNCWGDDTQGQRTVPALSGVTQLAVGGSHNCVIAQGSVHCWGGTSIPAWVNTIPALTSPTVITAGKSHSCAIDREGVHCWGDPAARDLTPRELTWPHQLVLGGSGERAFVCARHLQGVTCWGDNSLRQTEYNGYPNHVLYRSEAEIRASPELVWSILMDLDQYPLWNPYTIAMQSTLEVGDPMIMTVKMNDLITLTQTENIRVLEPGHKACWGIDTDTPELNSGERCQWLESLPGGRTRYVTEDLIEGALNALVLGLFDSDLRAGFDGVSRGLKTRAEMLASP